MNPNIAVWVTAAMTLVCTLLTIANTWAIAVYNRRSMERSQKPTKRRWLSRRAVSLLIGVEFWLSVLLMVPALLLRFPSPVLQMFSIAFLVGAAVLGILFSLIFKLINHSNDHLSLTNRQTAILDSLADALSAMTSLDSDKLRHLAENLQVHTRPPEDK